MNTYEAIFTRKSVRSYQMEAIPAEVLDDIIEYYIRIRSIFAGIETEVAVLDNHVHSRRYGIPGIRAPYYLAIYSERKDRAMMNAGYIMEQISLYLTTRGIGSCFFGSAMVPRALREKNGKQLIIFMAFGKAKDGCSRERGEARRLPLERICAGKEQPKQWAIQLLEAARMAPSSMNSQPWRFVIRDNRIHVFAVDGGSRRGKYREFNFGVMFSHLMTAAEELWQDVDLIRLEDISQKNFKNSEYVLSVIPSVRDRSLSSEERGRNCTGI